MVNSILNSTKKMVGGIDENDTFFDPDIIMHINTIIAILGQVGVGPSTGFRIEDSSAVWVDLIGDNLLLELVKSFVGIRVKLLFDPPQNSYTITLMEKQADEFLWRIREAVESKPTT